MYKKKFFFIVFEGIEGTGKSFQINKLFNKLKKYKIPIIKTREPGGSVTAEKIRNLIFGKKNNQFDKLTDYYLMLASRNEHIKKTLITAKKRKQIVICDRFTDSTYAYQVIGKNINNKLNEINKKYILGSIKPNLTIILKSTIKSVSQRIKKRKIKNKFDKLDKNFYLKVQKAFIKKAKLENNYFVLDSSANDNLLEKKIFKIIKNKLGLKY
jgi:dTMP kinase